MKKISTEKIPTWALDYLINDDAAGLTEKQVKEVDAFCDSFQNGNSLIFDLPDIDVSEYYTTTPAFGKPADVLDVDVYEA